VRRKGAIICSFSDENREGDAEKGGRVLAIVCLQKRVKPRQLTGTQREALSRKTSQEKGRRDCPGVSRRGKKSEPNRRKRWEVLKEAWRERMGKAPEETFLSLTGKGGYSAGGEGGGGGTGRHFWKEERGKGKEKSPAHPGGKKGIFFAQKARAISRVRGLREIIECLPFTGEEKSSGFLRRKRERGGRTQERKEKTARSNSIIKVRAEKRSRGDSHREKGKGPEEEGRRSAARVRSGEGGGGERGKLSQQQEPSHSIRKRSRRLGKKERYRGPRPETEIKPARARGSPPRQQKGRKKGFERKGKTHGNGASGSSKEEKNLLSEVKGTAAL